ncbi:MAG TPA: RNA polymerase sigma factor [Rhodanobacteraceae bacterium]|nr:RNA polymerase sigma factor [Rhodanobacteraceae bacterium]
MQDFQHADEDTVVIGATATALAPPHPTGAEAQPRSLNAFLAGVERAAFRTAQLGLGQREDALDAVQDAMLRLAQNYADKPPEEWTPLFWSILRRRITDLQRRRKVRSIMVGWLHGRSDEDGLPEWDPADQGPGPLDKLADRQSMSQLAAAVRKLPTRQREAFTLRVMNELDGATTARAMGCSEGSVKTHLSRAMHSLRQALEDWQ